MQSPNSENYNNNGFYFYLQKNDLSYIYYINQTAKGASNMQRIAPQPTFTCSKLTIETLEQGVKCVQI